MDDGPRWRRRKPVIRQLEFYVISAQELRNVKHTGRMKTYVAAYVHSEKKVYTRTDEEGGTNPSWNQKLCLEVDSRLLVPGSGAQLNFDIYAHSFFKDKLVGGVTIMLADAVRENSSRFPVTSHLIFTLDGDSQGILNICVPPGGRFPKRLDSLSFKKVLSDRGIQVEAVPSFKEVDFDEEEEEAEEAEAEAEDERVKPQQDKYEPAADDDEDLGIYDESFFDDSRPHSEPPAAGGAKSPNSEESRTKPGASAGTKSLLGDSDANSAAPGGPIKTNLPQQQQPTVNKDDDLGIRHKSFFNNSIHSRRSW